MAAATRVIAAQGLSAPTAVIAREAGVSTLVGDPEFQDRVVAETRALLSTISV